MAAKNGGDGVAGLFLKISGSYETAGRKYGEKVVGDAGHFSGGDFTGADVEVAVNLAGIGGNNLAVKFFSEADSKGGLAGGGGAENNKDFGLV